MEGIKNYVKSRPYLRWWLTVVLIPVLLVAELVRVLWQEYITKVPYSLWEVWNERPWSKPNGQYRKR